MQKLWKNCVVAAILLTTATSRVAYGACAENDLPCFRRGFLERGQEIDSLRRELGLKDQQVGTLQQQVLTQSVTIRTQNDALNAMAPALQAGERKWHESPQFWYGIGVGTGVLGTIAVVALSVWAVSQVR